MSKGNDMRSAKLRFRDFEDGWREVRVKDVLQKASRPVDVDPDELYRQIGIRSHGRGIFHKEAVTGASLGNKRVFWVGMNQFVVNIVFAWEQAVAVTTAAEKGMVASHRFPMYSVKDGLSDPDFILRLFLTKKGKHLLELASPGGAGRNKTLGQKEFEELRITLPSPTEQTRIAAFFASVDERISQLERKLELVKGYKRGAATKIFRQELRFKESDGRDFPEWDVVELGAVAAKVKTKNRNFAVSNVLTNSATRGVISQDDYFERDIVNEDNIHGYYVVDTDDFVYNPRISVSAPVGPVKRNRGAMGVMSPLYTVFRFRSGNPSFLEQYFETREWHDYMRSVANSGARHDRMNISNDDFFGMPLPFPSEREQEKIASFLSSLDSKIGQASAELEVIKRYKLGLLEQMFV